MVLQSLLGDGQPQSLKLSPIDVALGLELSDSRLAVLSRDCGELSEPLLVSLKMLPCIHSCRSIGVVAINLTLEITICSFDVLVLAVGLALALTFYAVH